MSSAEPQPVLTPLTEAAIILVLTVPAGGEDAVRDMLPDIGRVAAGARRSAVTTIRPSPAAGTSSSRSTSTT